MRAKGIWAGLTIGRAQPRSHIPPALVPMLEQRWTRIRTLVSAGVNCAFSTDAGISATKPHDVLPAELTYAATQGLSNAIVLAAATSQAASSCHVADRKGHLNQGTTPTSWRSGEPPAHHRGHPRTSSHLPAGPTDPVTCRPEVPGDWQGAGGGSPLEICSGDVFMVSTP